MPLSGSREPRRELDSHADSPTASARTAAVFLAIPFLAIPFLAALLTEPYPLILEIPFPISPASKFLEMPGTLSSDITGRA